MSYNVHEVLLDMKKKIAFLLILSILISILSITVFAANSDNSSADVELSLVTITQPTNSNFATFSRTFDLKGITDFDNVKVDLFIFNRDKNKYIPFQNTDGESSWNINTSGYFWKQIDLDSGLNKFRMVAYKISEKKKKQITDFAITVLDEKSINDGSLDMDTMFNKILEPSKK